MISTRYFDNRSREVHKRLDRERLATGLKLNSPTMPRRASYDVSLWRKTSYLC